MNAAMPPAESTADYLKAARAIDAGELPGLRPLRLAVLSTFTAQILAPYLTVEAARRGFALQTWFAPWGQLEQPVLDPASELYAHKPDAIVILTRLEELAPEAATRFLNDSAETRQRQSAELTERLASLMKALRRHTASALFVSNFTPPHRLTAGLADSSLSLPEEEFIRAANRALPDTCALIPDAFVFDLARVATEHGIKRWSDPKLFHLARVPMSVSAQIATAHALARTLRAALIPPKKVLVLDLDNTLWGGVLGEDGLGGIKLGDEYPGNVFKAFQRYVLALKDRGVLLAVATKNNPADVEELWEKHPDCPLRRADFAAVRVNWREKSANLRELAEELNLGLDAFVFFDDNPFEREEVRRHLPMVAVLEVPASPLGYIDAIDDSALFDRLTLTMEDQVRGELYQAQYERAAAREASESPADFLRSLAMVATIGEVNAETLPRVAQLLAKTNQFNLTTRRRSAAEIQRMLDAGAIALWLRLADRFGDNGLVGVAIAVLQDSSSFSSSSSSSLPAGGSDEIKTKRNGVSWRIDTFLLSCRVIGRAAETALLAHLTNAVVARGGSALLGEFLPTAKNALVADFYPRHGFTPAGEGRWMLDLPAPALIVPDFIRLQLP